MSENVLKLIVAIGRLSVQQKQNSNLFPQMNQSESGVFLAMLQIMAEKPDTELFPLGELNSYLDYTRPNLSQTINKLEDKNYVERVTLKDDRRVTYIRLTEEGKEMLQEKHSSIADRMNRIKDVLGEEDINKLIELLTRFIDTYEKTE
ncbi:MAG: winged helix-turn-helix transcriptional regulator [Ruminiclostridium sp.]|nr:winged helix-turn-helix transcriptional regulator [Ruminiclostridium sp.]